MSELNTNIDFLIITALNLERDAVIEYLGDFEKIQVGNEIPTYYQTEIRLPNRLESYKVTLILLLEMGNVDAGILGKIAIEKLNPKNIIMLGIAGGIAKNGVKIGDIVVGTSVGYYEPGKHFPDNHQFRPKQSLTNALLIDRFKNFNDNTWKDEISLVPPNLPYNSNIHFGLIAAGEKIVTSELFTEELLKYFPKLLAVEMESWGVLEAAWMSKNLPRFIPVRGISDNADKNKGDHWQKLAAQAAALYLKHFILSQPVVPTMGYLPIEFKFVEKVYVPPQEFEEISKILEEKRIIFITGTPEYGKTFTAIYLMWVYYNKGYKPEWIRGGEKSERVNVRKKLQQIGNLESEQGEKKIIYLEDPFGKIKYEERYDLERKIISILEDLKNTNDLYIIITSREEIFKEFKKRASSGMVLEAFEKNLSIGKPSYSSIKRKRILSNWATVKKCTWLKDKELKNFVLNKIDNEKNLPTILNIIEFIGASVDIETKEELAQKIKEKSRDTTWTFLKEIRGMSIYKMLFLTIIYILVQPGVEFVKNTYQNLTTILNLENATNFGDIVNWFKKDKIKIISKNRIIFSHDSYIETMDGLFREFNDYNSILFSLIEYLAEKDEALIEVSLFIAENFTTLPEKVRNILFSLARNEQTSKHVALAISAYFGRLPADVSENLLLILSKKKKVDMGLAHIITKNYNELSETVRQILFKLAKKTELALSVAFGIAENYHALPIKVKQILFAFANRDETAWIVTVLLVSYFDNIPENTRNHLLNILIKKDRTNLHVSNLNSMFLNKLSENERNKMLINLGLRLAKNFENYLKTKDDET